MSASPLAEQQELAGCCGPDRPAAHRSRSGIRQGGTAELPLQRLPAGEVAFSPPLIREFFLFFLPLCTFQLHKRRTAHGNTYINGIINKLKKTFNVALKKIDSPKVLLTYLCRATSQTDHDVIKWWVYFKRLYDWTLKETWIFLYEKHHQNITWRDLLDCQSVLQQSTKPDHVVFVDGVVRQDMAST